MRIPRIDSFIIRHAGDAANDDDKSRDTGTGYSAL